MKLMGSLEEKKALQKKSNICVAIAILSFAAMFALPSLMGNAAEAGMIAVFVFAGVGAITWIFGLMAYARSKGYSAVIGLLCLLGLIGLIILLILPDQWKVQAPPVVSETNYPRDPNRV